MAAVRDLWCSAGFSGSLCEIGSRSLLLPLFRLKFDLKLQNKAEISMRFEYDLNIKKYLTSKHWKLTQRNASVIARCLAL